MGMKFVQLLVIAVTLVTPALGSALTCSPMPAEITKIKSDVKVEVEASVGTLGKLKAGEIGSKVEVTSKALFDKFPNTDKLYVIQAMAATYCSMIRDASEISEKEKINLWKDFQKQSFAMISGNHQRGKSPSRTPTNTRQPVAQKTGDDVIDEVQASFDKWALSRTPPIETEVASTMALLFNRPAFMYGPREEWDQFLFVSVKTRLLLTKSLKYFKAFPDVRNEIVEATQILKNLEDSVATLYGPFSLSRHIQKYGNNREHFTNELRAVKTPNKAFYDEKDEQVRQLRLKMCAIGLADGCKALTENKERANIEETYTPPAGSGIPLGTTVALNLDQDVARLKVTFTYPISAKTPGTQLTVYSYQMLNNVRHEDIQENVFAGYWKPGTRGTFSIDVPRSYYDPASGRELRFCVGEPKSCYPSENILKGRKS